MPNVTIVSTGGKNSLPVRRYKTEAATSILEGDLVKIGGTGNNFAVLPATGDPEIGTDRIIGVAKSDSTDTAAAAGVVDVYMIDNRTVLRASATTGSNLGDGLLNDSVTLTVSSTDQSVNEDEGDDPDVHGLMILDYDADEDTVDFIVKAGALIDGLV